MGCETYHAEEGSVKFDEDNIDTACLCCFTGEEGRYVDSPLDRDTVRSMAYLGAAVVLLRRNDSPDGKHLYLPDDLPAWVRAGIDAILNGGPDAPA